MNPLQRAMAPLGRRVMLMIGRAVVEYINDGSKMQSAQVSLLDDETRSAVEHFQDYGFTSVAEGGAEAVALSVGGNRDHVIVLAVSDRSMRKIGLQPGEVAVYTKWGDYILLKEDEIEMKHGTKVRLVTPLVEATGDINAAGNIVAGGNVSDQGGAKSMAGMRAAHNGHRHNETGSITATPTGTM